jgi:hypothetical protein
MSPSARRSVRDRRGGGTDLDLGTTALPNPSPRRIPLDDQKNLFDGHRRRGGYASGEPSGDPAHTKEIRTRFARFRRTSTSSRGDPAEPSATSSLPFSGDSPVPPGRGGATIPSRAPRTIVHSQPRSGAQDQTDQHSVRDLRSIGIQPDLPLPPGRFLDQDIGGRSALLRRWREAVITAKDVSTISRFPSCLRPRTRRRVEIPAPAND